MRVLYGLDRIPCSLSPDDPRLPSVALGAEPLRLNTIASPLAAWSEVAPDAHWIALEAWLVAQCGDYNKGVRRSVTRYLAEVSARVQDCRGTLEAGLAPYGGLYRAHDWRWSALRPLPRAWWQDDGIWHRADIAYWDGARLIVDDLRVGDFWVGETLPRSPFRRVFRQSSP